MWDFAKLCGLRDPDGGGGFFPMEDERKKEMIDNTARLLRENDLTSCSIFIFGHSNASEDCCPGDTSSVRLPI